MKEKDVYKELLDLYIVSMDNKYDLDAMKLANSLREWLSVETNISSRSFNAQMKYANKIDAEYIIVLGEDEINNKECKIKNMKTGKEIQSKIDADSIIDAIFEYEEEI